VEGKKAPAFSLEDQDGKTVALSDFAGKDLLLWFYPAADTPGCTKEGCGFRDLWKEIRKTGVAVVGVSKDVPAKNKKFADKFKFPFPLLSDPTKAMMKKYKAFGEKMMYGKKVLGVIRSTVWIGPDGVVKKHWAKVPEAAAHPAKVLEALLA
jgi:peroxiredoxin Q/BCP